MPKQDFKLTEPASQNRIATPIQLKPTPVKEEKVAEPELTKEPVTKSEPKPNEPAPAIKKQEAELQIGKEALQTPTQIAEPVKEKELKKPQENTASVVAQSSPIQARPQEKPAQIEKEQPKEPEQAHGFQDGPPLDQIAPPNYFDPPAEPLPDAPPVATPAPKAVVVETPKAVIAMAESTQAELPKEEARLPVAPVELSPRATHEVITLKKDPLDQAIWREFLEGVQTNISPGFYSLLKTTVPLKLEGKRLTLACSNLALSNSGRLLELQSLALEFFGNELVFYLEESKETSVKSMIKQEFAEKDQVELEAQELAKESPFVKRVKELFSGTEVVAVTPLKEK